VSVTSDCPTDAIPEECLPVPAARGAPQRLRPPKKHAHIPALDGLRGVAILLVMVNHVLLCQPRYLSASFSLSAAWQAFAENICLSAGYGVQLFFVLSGFLITGILLDSKGSKSYFLSFYGRRTLRIFPVYYGTLLVFTLLYWAWGSDFSLFLRRLPWLLTYTDNILMTIQADWVFIFDGHSLGHFWSLAVEEQFYLVWPWVVLCCSARQLKWICCLAIPIGLAFRTALYVGRQNLVGAIVFLPCQLDPLVIGGLLALLVRERKQGGKGDSRHLPPSFPGDTGRRAAAEKGTVPPALSFQGIGAAKAWLLFKLGAVLWILSCCDSRLLLTSGITGFAVMSAGLLALALSGEMPRLFCMPLLRSLGKYSYAIYVYHVILLPIVFGLVPEMPARGLCAVVLYFAASYLAGWLSWHAVEARFLRLKRLFPVEKTTLAG
jgi:peptidoglycan/LPS O-acetylase OafA/YrhL